MFFENYIFKSINSYKDLSFFESMVEKDVDYLMDAFYAARILSQDANTQTGAKIVSLEGSVLAIGANRMHFGIKGRFEEWMSFEDKILIGRPEKYTDLTHAERDVIYTAFRTGHGSLVQGATLYCTWNPCVVCAEAIANSGIKRVVTHRYCSDWYAEKQENMQRVGWDKSIKDALSLLQRCGVKYDCLEVPIPGIRILFDDILRETK